MTFVFEINVFNENHLKTSCWILSSLSFGSEFSRMHNDMNKIMY